MTKKKGFANSKQQTNSKRRYINFVLFWIKKCVERCGVQEDREKEMTLNWDDPFGDGGDDQQADVFGKNLADVDVWGDDSFAGFKEWKEFNGDSDEEQPVQEKSTPTAKVGKNGKEKKKRSSKKSSRSGEGKTKRRKSPKRDGHKGTSSSSSPATTAIGKDLKMKPVLEVDESNPLGAFGDADFDPFSIGPESTDAAAAIGPVPVSPTIPEDDVFDSHHTRSSTVTGDSTGSPGSAFADFGIFASPSTGSGKPKLTISGRLSPKMHCGGKLSPSSPIISKADFPSPITGNMSPVPSGRKSPVPVLPLARKNSLNSPEKKTLSPTPPGGKPKLPRPRKSATANSSSTKSKKSSKSSTSNKAPASPTPQAWTDDRFESSVRDRRASVPTRRLKLSRGRDGRVSRIRPSEQNTRFSKSEERRGKISESLMEAIGADDKSSNTGKLSSFLRQDSNATLGSAEKDLASVQSAPAMIRQRRESRERLPATTNGKSRRYNSKMQNVPFQRAATPTSVQKETVKLDIAQLVQAGYFEVQDGKMRLVIDVET